MISGTSTHVMWSALTWFWAWAHMQCGQNLCMCSLETLIYLDLLNDTVWTRLLAVLGSNPHLEQMLGRVCPICGHAKQPRYANENQTKINLEFGNSGLRTSRIEALVCCWVISSRHARSHMGKSEGRPTNAIIRSEMIIESIEHIQVDGIDWRS